MDMKNLIIGSKHLYYFIAMCSELSKKDLMKEIDGLELQRLAIVSGYAEFNTNDL